MATAVRNKQKCNANNIKPGTKYSRISYGTIVRVDYDTVTLRNEEGIEWGIAKQLVDAEFYTPDQFDSVKEVNRTDMVQAIVSNPRIVMTVTFKKQADPKDLKTTVLKLLQDTKAGAKIPATRKLSTILKQATEGESRTMVGRHHGGTDEFGRLQFTDMEVDSGHNLRLVDPRTVEEAIFGNVKYKVK
jgi:hypothetical protein